MTITLRRKLTEQDRLDGLCGAYVLMDVRAWEGEPDITEYIAAGWSVYSVERYKDD